MNPGRAALAMLPVLAGCAAAFHPAPANPVSDPDVLLARMSARRAALPVVSAVARAESYSSRGALKGKVTFLLDGAGRVRVDAWSPSDDLLAVLTADPESFMYFERGAHECLAGRSCPSNLAILLPLGLDVREAASALLGFPPVRPPATAWSMSWDTAVGAYRLVSGTRDGRVQQVWLRDDGTPVRAAYGRPGKPDFEVELSGFRAEGTFAYPAILRFRLARDRADVTVKYRSLDVSPKLDPKDWGFDCPQGARTRDVSCQEESQ